MLIYFLQCIAALLIVTGAYTVTSEIYALLHKDSFKHCTLICCGSTAVPEKIIRYAIKNYTNDELYIYEQDALTEENSEIIEKLSSDYDFIHILS